MVLKFYKTMGRHTIYFSFPLTFYTLLKNDIFVGCSFELELTTIMGLYSTVP